MSWMDVLETRERQTSWKHMSGATETCAWSLGTCESWRGQRRLPDLIVSYVLSSTSGRVCADTGQHENSSTCQRDMNMVVGWWLKTTRRAQSHHAQCSSETTRSCRRLHGTLPARWQSRAPNGVTGGNKRGAGHANKAWLSTLANKPYQHQSTIPSVSSRCERMQRTQCAGRDRHGMTS